MSNLEIKNKFDSLLKKLSSERSFDVAEKISIELSELLNIKTKERFLLNIPRIDAELTRFQLAPGFARQAAAYELPHEGNKPFDLKLFWVKKATKTNLSWIVGLTPNFEDAASNDYKNIGIDFVVPETCDSIIVLLSNRFKIRALELKDHITPTQLEIFTQWEKISEIDIIDQNEFKNTLHSKLWESFNFEPINRKFYLELVEHFSILVHHLEKDFGRKPSVMFTTRLIGRLLFIWFLKKKSLINDKIDYFSIPDIEKQKDYYENKLEKLFFEVLNREELERNNGDKLTPYLNGGLFDKNTTDFYSDPKLTFPNGYFNQLFATLNKYNFTVDESSPEFQHVAIDPEMLGRIFESLLAEQIDEITGNSKKKATGAFYTPREIVSYMCEQSLIEFLKTKVPDAPDRDRRIEELVRMPEAIFRDQDQNKRRDWKPYREAIIGALEGSKTESPLTVLDPAVGSGAFPMGMLHLLVKVYSRLDPKFEKDISGLKRGILSRSLYGVDIEQTAIEITRLRAWLSIIVDISEDEKVEPLPNLEFKFVCANTLIPLDNTEQASFFTDHDLKDKLITIRNDYFKTSSKAKKEKLQKDYLKLTQSVSLFDNKKTQQLKSYKPFDISSSSEFYDPELMHGVQAFDIVIGNPPYVSYGLRGGQKMSEGDKKIIRQLFPDSAEYKISLYALFMDKAISLSNEKGVQSFIVPDSFLLGRYFSKVRRFILKMCLIHRVILFNYCVFDATVGFSVVYVTQKSLNTKNHTISVLMPKIPDDLYSNNYFIYPQSYFDSTKYNRFRLFFDKNTKDLIQKIENDSIELGSIYTGRTGVRSKIGQKNIISNEKKTDKYQKGIVSGGQIKRYSISYDGDYINIDPLILNSGGWDYNVINNPKILIRQTGDELIASIDKENYYHLNNVHSFSPNPNIEVELEYILGILNSKLMNYFYRNTTLEVGRPMAQTDIETLESLPIKIKKDRSEITNLVNKILTLKKQNVNADTKNLEAQIDQLVYKLYDLTPEEIEIIENSSKK